jgi:hypothetical protein
LPDDASEREFNGVDKRSGTTIVSLNWALV